MVLYLRVIFDISFLTFCLNEQNFSILNSNTEAGSPDGEKIGHALFCMYNISVQLLKANYIRDGKYSCKYFPS